MKLVPKIAVGVLAVIGLLYVGVLISVQFIDPDCTTYPIRKIASPSKRFIAELENRECRSSHNIESYVWLYLGSDPRSRWSVFIGPASYRMGASSLESPLALDIIWISDSEVQISFPQGVEPRSGEGIKNGVKVTYRETQPLSTFTTESNASPNTSEEAAMKIMLKAYPGPLKDTQTFGPFESTLQSDVPAFAKKGEKVWHLGIKCNKGEHHASFFVHQQTAKLFFIRGPNEKLPLQCD